MHIIIIIIIHEFHRDASLETKLQGHTPCMFPESAQHLDVHTVMCHTKSRFTLHHITVLRTQHVLSEDH